MAHRTSSQTQARTAAQTTPGAQAEETTPFLARRSLPDDLTPWKLSAVQRQQVEQINLNDELHAVYVLSQEFVTLLKERQAEALDSWLKRAKESRVTELSSFVNGIRRDYAAVHAACSLSWSNGTTEGHVNRLKFLKRQMFGRAHLDLLRVKVLHAV